LEDKLHRNVRHDGVREEGGVGGAERTIRKPVSN
jgi:hypothetical protein